MSDSIWKKEISFGRKAKEPKQPKAETPAVDTSFLEPTVESVPFWKKEISLGRKPKEQPAGPAPLPEPEPQPAAVAAGEPEQAAEPPLSLPPGDYGWLTTNFDPTAVPGQQRAIGDCSAHWFTVKGNIVALGNYEQGTRFVDVSDPRNPQQVGYFRVPAQGTRGTPGEVVSSNTAGAYWHGSYVYVSDYARGIDVLKFVRSHHTYKDVPIIVLTTRGDEQSRQIAAAAGATTYLTKPFAPQVLASAARTLLGAASN